MDMDVYAPPKAPLVDPTSPPGSGLWLGVPADLGPLGVFTRSLRVFAEHFGLILGVYAVVHAPHEAVTLALAFGGSAASRPKGNEILSGAVSFGLDSLAGPIVLIALLARAREPEAAGLLTAALRFGLRRWWAVLRANTAAALFIWLGMLCTAVPGVILAVRYAVVTPVAVLEAESSPRVRSTDLTRGHGWRVLATLLVTHLPVYAVLLLLANLLSPRHRWYATVHTWYFTLAFDLLRLMAGGFLTVCALVLYISLRQSAEPGWPPTPDPTRPSPP